MYNTLMFLLAPFFASFIISGFLFYSRQWHLRFSGDHDTKGPQKIHQTSTPRIGGVAIFIGIQVGIGGLLLADNPLVSELFYILFASTLAFAVALAEDLTKTVGIKWRLLSTILSGMIFVLLFEINAIRLDIFYLDTLLQNFWMALLFLSFAISGLSNAYNIIDGLNGLASMVGIISLCAITYVGLQVGDALITTMSLLMIAAMTGFFLWNYPRGLLFLGDSGAYLIGFLIACLSILLVARHAMVSPWFALMVNAYPVFETLYTMWRRTIRQGKNMGLPDSLHIHSLIYNQILRKAPYGAGKPHYRPNAKTSPYVWMLSCIGVVPAVIWWESSKALMLAAVGFMLLYVSLYRKMVRCQIQG